MGNPHPKEESFMIRKHAAVHHKAGHKTIEHHEIHRIEHVPVKGARKAPARRRTRRTSYEY